ncbi:MAG: PAS domain-containing sensor histidine kinase [Promethearchaeota archaeon]
MERYWFELIGKQFYDKDGKNKAILFLRDITALKEAEEKFKFITDNTNDLISVYNKDLNLIYINESLKKFSGFDLEDVICKKSADFAHPEDMPRAFQFFKDVFEKGTALVDIRMRKKDGTYTWMECSGKLVKNEKNEPIIICVSRDFTERKKLNDALRHSEELFRKIVNNITDVLFEASIEGILNYISPQIRLNFGYDDEEMLNQNIWDFLPPEDSKQFKEKISEAIKNNQRTVGIRSFFRYKKGNDIPIFLNLSIVKIGKEIKLFGVLSDITERYTLEQEIVQLKNLDQLKDNFLTMVAHELKTPLSSISGYTEYILTKYVNLDKDIRENLLIVQKNVNRLNNYIKQILDVMKIDADKIELNLEPVNIKDLIYNYIAEEELKIKQNKLEVKVEIPDDLSLIVDYQLFEQIIMNLISNAIKFTPPGGCIYISALQRENDVLFEIMDTGCGLNKEEINQIFNKFVKFNKNCMTDQYLRGSGLGLYITKGFIEKHGGKIWAESEGLGKGASFKFTIPIR